MTSVKLPDGSVKDFEGSVSVKDVAKSIGSRLAKDAMWGEINLQPPHPYIHQLSPAG